MFSLGYLSDAPICFVHRYLPVSVSNAEMTPVLDCTNRCVSSTTMYISLSRFELIVAWLHQPPHLENPDRVPDRRPADPDGVAEQLEILDGIGVQVLTSTMPLLLC